MCLKHELIRSKIFQALSSRDLVLSSVHFVNTAELEGPLGDPLGRPSRSHLERLTSVLGSHRWVGFPSTLKRPREGPARSKPKRVSASALGRVGGAKVPQLRPPCIQSKIQDLALICFCTRGLEEL